MKHSQKIRHFLLVTLLCFLLVSLVTPSIISSSGDYVVGSDFGLFFKVDESLGLQNSPSKFVILKVTSGTLNGTNTSVRIYDGGGVFRFTSINNTNIQITYTVTTVKASGDQDNTLRFVSSGSTILVDAGDNVVITWDIEFELLFPILFMFGMVGLFAMFVGPSYAVYEIKHRKYQEGAITGFLVTIIGVILFITWLSA